MRTQFLHYDTVYSKRLNAWVERPVMTPKTLTDSEIVSIFEQHTDKTQLDLIPPVDASGFWYDLASDVLYCWVYDDESKKWKHNYYSDSTNLYYAKTFAQQDDLVFVNNKGKLLKRFSKWVKRESGHDIDPATMGRLGDKLQYYINKDSRFVFDFHQGIDWEDGMFGHSGSCWWDEYGDSRPTFDGGGGWAIRFYESMEDRNGCGRTWLVAKYNHILGFNSYGVQRPQVVQVLTQLFQSHGITLTYKDAEITNRQNSTIPYINGGTGFVMFEGSTSLNLDRKVDIDFDVVYDEDNRYTCESCGARLSDDESNSNEYGNIYCDSCYSERYFYCEHCENECNVDEQVYIQDSRKIDYVCESCAKELGAVQCYDCDKWFIDSWHVAEDGDYPYCDNCFESHVEFTCDKCGCAYEYTDGCESCGTGSCAPAEEESDSESDSSEDETQPNPNDCISTTCDVNLVLKNRKEVRTVKHWIVPNIPGLFVYNGHDVDSESKGYYVIHAESGLAASGIIKSWPTAMAYMRRLGPLHDWTLTKYDLHLETISGKVYEIRQELGIR